MTDSKYLFSHILIEKCTISDSALDLTVGEMRDAVLLIPVPVCVV